jgi:predicted alpha/beta-fold hydrolase
MKRFTPAFGLGNPHLQTLWGPLWRKTVHLDRERERLWLDDGDFLDLDWHGPHSAEAPLVLVLHGLTGSSNSPYVAGIQAALAAQGWASVALNWRGCSGEPNLLPRSYHSGASEDLAEAIKHCGPSAAGAAVCGRLFIGRQRVAQASGRDRQRQRRARCGGGVGAVSP